MRDEQCKAWNFQHGETPRRCHLGPNHAGFHQNGSLGWDELIATYPLEPQINHPDHYTWMKNGVEVIDITSQFSFTLGNALKCIMRAGHKGNALADLKKARWYIDYEIKRIEEE